MSEEKEPRVGAFLFLTYPESMGDVYEKIEASGVTCVRSPLHDSDINVKTGELKKPHYHNAIIFSSGVKSRNQCRLLAKSWGIDHIEFPFDLRNSLRYWCHLDCEPYDISGKFRYDISDVKVIGCFDYSSILTKKDGIDSQYTTLFKWAKENRFTSFRNFVNRVANEMPNYIDVVIDKAYFFNLYVTGYDGQKKE